jgi:hypothetical protein
VASVGSRACHRPSVAVKQATARKLLLSPDGWRISRNDALAVSPLHAQLSAYRSEIPHLKKCTDLAEQPIPREASDKIAGNTQPQRRLKSAGGSYSVGLGSFRFRSVANIQEGPDSTKIGQDAASSRP